MRKGQYRFVAGFLFAPVALYLIFVIWPYLQTFGYSLTDWKGQSQTFKFVGLDNYKALFQDDVFMQAIWHNILFLIFIPVITILLALFFAFMLNAGGRSKAAWSAGSRRIAGLQGRLLLSPGAVAGDRRRTVQRGVPQ